MEQPTAGSPDVAQPSEDEVVITRVFDAPREAVWAAWTEPERMKRWWGPKTWTAPVARMDVREGGKYVYNMGGPDGPGVWATGTYREVVRPERLVMTDSFADEDGNIVSGDEYGMPDFPRELLITVTFEEQDGKTKMTLRHAGVASVSATDRAMMEQGWSESFDKLAEMLAEG